jgi:shikimate dehydrogenase
LLDAVDRMNDENGQRRAACVIGWPAAHSRSPLIHNYWLDKYRIAGEYRRETVPPERFAEFLSHLADRGYVGANVTIPHKEAALAITEPDDCAQAIGAANTVWLEDGALRSTNTDAEGFLANLDAAAPGWDHGIEAALVLGAGGAARAVVYALVEHGVPRIYLANRTAERGEALASRFGAAVRPIRWEEAGGLLGAAQLLVNATSLGMHGEPPLEIRVDRLAASAVVADLVYAPLDTPLLVSARARGLRVADGLGMLLHQAVRGFSLWFGPRPEVTQELRALAEDDLRGPAVAE